MSTKSTISRHGMTLPMDRLTEFCRRWKIQELSLFGSYLRDDFRPDSDLDFLYTFADDSAGHVSGQGVQNFFVATPALTATGTSSAAPTPAPTSGSGY